MASTHIINLSVVCMSNVNSPSKTTMFIMQQCTVSIVLSHKNILSYDLLPHAPVAARHVSCDIQCNQVVNK